MSKASTVRSPATTRSTGPPAAGTRARWTLPPSSRRKWTNRPSGEKRGELALRSRESVNGFDAPPPAGTTATWFVPYHMSLGSPPARYAIHFPSGLKTGDSSAPGDEVTARASPPVAFTTKTSALRFASGSAVRLLVNAIHFPSGDHDGAPSSFGPDVTWRPVFFSTSKTWTCFRISRRYPSPSRMNCRRWMTIGLGVLGFFSPSPASLSSLAAALRSGSSGSTSQTTRARRVPSGDQARSETLAL